MFPCPFLAATLAPCLASLSPTPALLASVPPCLLLQCLLFCLLLWASVCFACCSCLVTLSRSLFALLVSLSARLLVFVDSPMSVASNGEGQRKQASEQRDKQSKAQTQSGNRATTNRQSKQKPKATGRTASTAVEDKAGQTRVEQGSGTGRPSREQG